MSRLLSPMLFAVAFSAPDDAAAQGSAREMLAPTGTLRIGLNGANTTLVERRPDGSAAGLAVEVGAYIAGKLGVPLAPIVYSGSEAYTGSFDKGEWDLIVTGRNAFAGTKVAFGPDIIRIEYVFVARPGFAIADAGAVDRPGTRIGVPRNASADVFLRDKLTAATLVRMDGTTATALAMLRANEIDVYGTITSSVTEISEQLPGARLVPGVFNTVGFAVSLPKDRSPEALAQLTRIVGEAKKSGVVEAIIARTGAEGALVAPD